MLHIGLEMLKQACPEEMLNRVQHDTKTLGKLCPELSSGKGLRELLKYF
jgi:hypothetical protein